MSGAVEAPIVVFDSVCVLCCAGLRWITRHDRRSHWRFLAMQSPRDIGGIYGILAAIGGLLPKALRDAAYRLVARNRYRWFGRRQSCYVPAAEESDRTSPAKER
jgi:predicted DCC family thiol-disulfide oxidoreductase YuxK